MAALAPADLQRLCAGEPGRSRRTPLKFRSQAKEATVQATEKIWMNGELVDWDDARIHVGAHGLHYGTGVFEGIRCYDTPKGPAVFRGTDHMQRLHQLGAPDLHEASVLGRGAHGRLQRAARARTA